MFKVGERIVKSCTNGLIFHGRIVHAIVPDDAESKLDQVDHNGKYRRQFDRRDPDWRKFPVYLVEPDSNQGPATLSEAQAIVPQLTAEQYDLLMHSRYFLVIESDLLPEIFEPEFPVENERNE